MERESEFIESVISYCKFIEVCEIKVDDKQPTFSYDNYNDLKILWNEKKECVYLWVIKDNERPVDVIYVGLIENTTLKERNKLHERGFKGEENGGSQSGGNLKKGILERKGLRKIVVYIRESRKIECLGENEISIHAAEEAALIKKFSMKGFVLLNKKGIKKDNTHSNE